MQKVKKLIIAGGGETALLANEYFSCDSGYEPVCFAMDKNVLPESKTMAGLPVECLDDIENKYDPSAYDVFVAVSGKQLNYPRTELCRRMKEKGYKLASYVSSDCSIWRTAEIGDNCFVLSQTILQPFSRICDNVFLWVRSNIGHRSVVEENCFLATVDVAGFSRVGHNSYLGVHSIVADERIIGHDNYLGMDCCIAKNTKPNSLYVGNPAKKQPISAREFCGVEERDV